MTTEPSGNIEASHNDEKSKLKINMDNALINAVQNLNLSEKRVVMFAVAKLDTLKNDGGTSSGKVRITAIEYAKHYKIDTDTAYTQLQTSSRKVMKKQVYWYEEGEKGKERIEINWLSKSRYAPGLGFVEIWFSREIQPYLVLLDRCFTSYHFSQTRELKSIYSWRLLELLTQYQSTGWRQISVDDFADVMQATEKQRENFAAIRRKIIQPAVQELTKKNGWVIDWIPIKVSRKVSYIRFEFKKGSLIEGEVSA